MLFLLDYCSIWFLFILLLVRIFFSEKLLKNCLNKFDRIDVHLLQPIYENIYENMWVIPICQVTSISLLYLFLADYDGIMY